RPIGQLLGMDVLEDLHVAADDEEVISLLVHSLVAGDEGIGARMPHREVQGDGYTGLHRSRNGRELERVLAGVERIAGNERHPTLPTAAYCFARCHLWMHRTEPRGGSGRSRALLGSGAKRQQYDEQRCELISSHSDSA